MSALSSSDEVFKYLREKYGLDADGDMNSIGLFIYALIEKDRVDWVDHVIAETNNAPTTNDIANWFLSKPQSYFLEKERNGESWYAGFARIYLRDEIERDQKQAIRNTIGQLGKFWPQFWMGNFVGITSNILFALLVVGLVAVITTDFSFIAFAKRIFGAH